MNISLNRRSLVSALTVAAAAVAFSVCCVGVARAQNSPADSPQALIEKVSTEVLDTVKADKAMQAAAAAGDNSKIIAVVDSKVMPHVNFGRMTAGAVGRSWREATPEQKKRLQEEFKTLLVRTYSGAVAQIKDQTVGIKPMRAAASDTEVLVRTEIKGKGEPIQLDYRLEKADGAWKIYDVNVMGIWLVQTYQTQFAGEIGKGGIDGLINTLAARNKSGAKKG
jgi:phospholipid transport system substrate-binding protein